MESFHQRVRCGTTRCGAALLLTAVLCLGGRGVTGAAEFAEAKKLFIAGHYQMALQQAEEGVKADETNEEWRLLLIQSNLAVGRYPQAHAALTNCINRWPMSSSIRVRWIAREVFSFNGDSGRAREMLGEINQLAGSRRWDYRNPPSMVVLGRAALLLGADPKLVLDQLLEPAKKADADNRDTHLAIGELALGKGDYELAGKVFQAALTKFPEDPDVLFGVAKSFSTGDRKLMLGGLEKALEHNTNHAPSLLLLADHLVDAEEYDEAEKLIKRVVTVNPWHPEAWAYRAILAHLRSDAVGEHRARATALKFHTNNPAVDHLIGRKLSQKYRFAEGAAAQRQALRFDRAYLPAAGQLASDLLRLGDEEEGWSLADDVYKADGYDVAAYNLVTLKDAMAKFQSLTNEHFIVRMSPREAAIYGPKVLALLGRAKTNLCQKYGLKLDQPTIVEIFPEQKDFAVRTFGMPGGIGYLGVCFGCVITANSPASQAAHPSNWEAVLWHEFCHVVTLSLTKNKMPRWLSEGISVYEERQANPTWGQAMTPRYREMVLGKDLTPVGDLSAAFLAPKSDVHLQFAYYESSLVVEFLVGKFGLDAIKKILTDLGKGAEINATIAKHTAPLEKIEKDFAAFAKERAEKLAPGLDFEKPLFAGAGVGRGMRLSAPVIFPPRPVPTNAQPAAVELTPESVAEWIAKHPTNFYALTQNAKQLMTQKKFAEAKAPLQKLIDLYPGHTGADNAYTLLAQVHRGLTETNAERAVLAKLAALEADATDAYTRLMELSAAARDWPAVAQNAERYLAVNPLVAAPHRQLARASEELKQPKQAIDAYSTLLLLDPPDPAEVHFRLAKLLHEGGSAMAREHVLKALEEAPRFRNAHRLLLEIEAKSPKAPTGATAADVKKP